MSVEVAFLLGFLVGQWVSLWATWRAVEKLAKILATLEANSKSPLSREIIEIKTENTPDLD